jgi:lysophospholipase L1-like esterase
MMTPTMPMTMPSTLRARPWLRHAAAAIAVAGWSALPAVAAPPATVDPVEGAVPLAAPVGTDAALAPRPAPTPTLASLAPTTRWDAAFAAFAAADLAAPPPEGAILFVGSSSIRLWDGLEDDFAVRKVVLKRGFGGSKLSDCVQNLGRPVVRYKPSVVMVYAGDNDLAAGSRPDEVLRRFVAFVDGVHRALPATRIDYISIKPSPLRAALLPEIRATNALIRDYIAGEAGVTYVDVFTPMIDADGQPRAELFAADRLHLNRDGYALWKSVIGPYVREAAR